MIPGSWSQHSADDACSVSLMAWPQTLSAIPFHWRFRSGASQQRWDRSRHRSKFVTKSKQLSGRTKAFAGHKRESLVSQFGYPTTVLLPFWVRLVHRSSSGHAYNRQIRQQVIDCVRWFMGIYYVCLQLLDACNPMIVLLQTILFGGHPNALKDAGTLEDQLSLLQREIVAPTELTSPVLVWNWGYATAFGQDCFLGSLPCRLIKDITWYNSE